MHTGGMGCIGRFSNTIPARTTPPSSSSPFSAPSCLSNRACRHYVCPLPLDHSHCPLASQPSSFLALPLFSSTPSSSPPHCHHTPVIPPILKHRPTPAGAHPRPKPLFRVSTFVGVASPSTRTPFRSQHEICCSSCIFDNLLFTLHGNSTILF